MLPQQTEIADLVILVNSVNVAIRTPDELAADWSVLDCDERQRASGFRMVEHRHMFVAAHALLRRTLSRCASVSPAEWRFRRTPNGRPEVASPQRAIKWRFSLSHATTFAICAVAEGVDVGIDTEDVRRYVPEKLVRRALGPSEAASLIQLPPERQNSRFFLHWTLKEAYLKARGIGLNTTLHAISFCVSDDSCPLAAHGSSDCPSGDWLFLSFGFRKHMLVSVAARCGGRRAAIIMDGDYVNHGCHAGLHDSTSRTQSA